MASIQPRGDKFQLRIKNRLLPKPFFHTFDTYEEADKFGEHLEGLLKKGIVPADLLEQERVNVTPLVLEVVRAYTLRAPITDSDDELLDTVIKHEKLKGARVADITFKWAEEYVSALKTEELAPSTIRKRIGVLARVLDWHFKDTAKPGEQLPMNVLRQLPDGYSLYSDGKVVDQQRDVRLSSADVESIERVLAGEKREDKERPWPTSPEFRLFYHLIVDTGLRLSEAFTLRADQFDKKRAVLNVNGSKGHRGKLKPRVVPLKPALFEELRAWNKGRIGLMFSFWNGTKEDKRLCSSRLTARSSWPDLSSSRDVFQILARGCTRTW